MDSVVFVVLISLSALFAASETALFSLRESQVRVMVKNAEWNARLIALMKNDPHRLLATLLFGNTIVNVTVGSLAAISAVAYGDSVGIGVATGIATVAILIFGEIVPKSFAIMHNRKVAQFTAYPIYFCYLVFFPISSIFVLIEKWIRRATNAQAIGAVSEEEIRIMSDLGVEHGGIDHLERQMIENVFNFDDTPVGRIMTPKKRIESLDGDVPVEQIAFFVSQSGFSRFPVYDGGPKNYIGYVHTNDVMRVLNSDDRELPLKEIASPLMRVEESTPILNVFRQMTKERSHLYLVHKTGNSRDVTGIVSMEDVLEELVGEIEDEGDKRAHPR